MSVNSFHQVKEVEEVVAQNERQCDLSSNAEDMALFSGVRDWLQHALVSEEVFFFRQQSSVHWVQERDANTLFFFLCDDT